MKSKELIERLKLLRQHLNLSQQAFADKLGISSKTIVRYETGQSYPTEKTLRLIEQTFSVNPEWLRHGRGEMFLPKNKEAGIDPFEAAAEAVIDIIIRKKDIKIPPDKKRKLVKKLAELMKQIGEKEAMDLIDLAV
jgi:transcriptional regulator with XRE-family HTH domain